jgi:D-alanyl-D-alanine carboxypeptidase/D-alanyl-D-alanine-endopeptidase (penicillin-binding protein 4)
MFRTPVKRLVVLVLGAALAGAPAAQAADPAATARALARQMAAAGPGSGAYVVDLDTGAELFADDPDVPRIPASVQKLFTTSTALLRYGPLEHLTTEVRSVQGVDELGVLDGNLVLRGGGDPTFGDRQARELAAALVAQLGLQEVTGRVLGDESAFDSRRGTPASGYRTSIWIGPLSALSYNRGRDGRHFAARPALVAARAFERALEREGVEVRRGAREGLADPQAAVLGQWTSPTIAELTEQINRPSDNYAAETLLKGLGARFGGGGSTAGGARVVNSTLARFDVRPRVIDGSGLSRRNRTTPREVVRLLVEMANTETGDVFADSLAVAGRTGTLDRRMRGSAAQDACRAKTGTLNGVSNLAGYCDSRSGRRVAFAFLMSGVTVNGAHRLQDRMASSLARYSP